jgi:hypothetical protein
MHWGILPQKPELHPAELKIQTHSNTRKCFSNSKQPMDHLFSKHFFNNYQMLNYIHLYHNKTISYTRVPSGPHVTLDLNRYSRTPQKLNQQQLTVARRCD